MAHKVGTDIDAWCTRCRLDTIHVVVALGADGETARRVECKSCGGQHMYRKSKAEREAEKKLKASSRRKVAKKTTSAKGSRASASTAKAAPEPAANVREWSDRIAAFQTQGTAPSPYTIRATFSEGEYVDHKKFGKGVVLEVVSADKINVLFEDGARTLIMGRV